MVVLDEFDKSLQMGFHEPLQVLFKALSGKTTTSAHLGNAVRCFAGLSAF